jgi:hypothetical protein
MRQAGNRGRLTLQAGTAVRISGEVAGKDLDRDGAVQAGVSGLVDLPHPSGTDEGHDLVGAEPRAGGKGHDRRPDYTPNSALRRCGSCPANRLSPSPRRA